MVSMCGLYSFRKSAEEVAAIFRLAALPVMAARDYVTPGGPIAILRNSPSGLELAHVRWGLIPAWVKVVEPSAKPLINARAETILEKPSFRQAIRRRRCLIPADGFYEWVGESGRKQAFHITHDGGALFCFAGIWESWMGADGSEMESAAIITTQANRTIGIIHHRMPVVIDPEDQARWLDCRDDKAEGVLDLLKASAEDYFTAAKVEIARARREPPVKPKPAQLDLF